MDGRINTDVVIATRNRRDELLRTAQNLLALRPRPRVVVVDNASTDGTAEAVERLHPQVELIRAPHNLGAAARNLGVLSSRAEYVAFSDDDSWWEQDALPRAEHLFATHPGIGLIAAKTLVGTQDRLDPVNDLMARSPLLGSPGLPGPRVLGFTACAAVVRRRAFQEAGGFDPVLFFGAEEKLLACDLAAAGWDLVYADDVVAHHHPSPARMSRAEREALELRNNVIIAWMRRSPPAAVTETLHALRRSRRATAGALRRLPVALRRRRRLPEQVERELTTVESQTS
ncbi:glycosyltransferase family 2 protein [Saccharopolyspora rhizosphaerae]|uniref:Glycosyltransferase family 2 protein n=1 Tax=Saccharopolyspora rhizosphaerae TaxID=2492662 RepID=A0A3R8NVL3_9PSEU|nr:glycosyltransferase family 2 protein [Saccharopolyspora rhizosphaerae]RRO14190.1 glycosyltransferase family 2 protein [Saccharopolyspora rhizosphaerae]